jgi:cell division septation protein DedD
VPTAAIRDGGWKLQLGAFGEAGNAQKLWSQVGGRFPGRKVSYVKSGRLTKVLVGPFASSAEASAACRSLSPCVPVRE